MQEVAPKPIRWTREQYIEMSEMGFFIGRKVELIGGEILEMAAQHDIHLAAIDMTKDALQQAFGPGYWVRAQGSLDLSPHGIPDPDIAVVLGSRQGAGQTIATSALLVVEVSNRTLAYDRVAKTSLYAAGGIADYWIVNLVDRQLEIHRNPITDPSKLFGFGYSSRTILDPGDAIAPLAAPKAPVTVTSLYREEAPLGKGRSK
jgi:Uma2 family endonuclease